MRKLIPLINPSAQYPVNYTILQNGTRAVSKTALPGRDLTERQIFELWQSGYFNSPPILGR